MLYYFLRKETSSMGHKIAEAIIEDGQIKYINRRLPPGRIRAHLIYDSAEEPSHETEMSRIVRETSGIYKDIDAEAESKKVRLNWERNAHN
jgi:hypothetical protein